MMTNVWYVCCRMPPWVVCVGGGLIGPFWGSVCCTNQSVSSWVTPFIVKKTNNLTVFHCWAAVEKIVTHKKGGFCTKEAVTLENISSICLTQNAKTLHYGQVNKGQGVFVLELINRRKYYSKQDLLLYSVCLKSSLFFLQIIIRMVPTTKSLTQEKQQGNSPATGTL